MKPPKKRAKRMKAKPAIEPPKKNLKMSRSLNLGKPKQPELPPDYQHEPRKD